MIYFINDGYGIIGTGYECEHCDKVNSFITLDDDYTHECEHCGKVNKFSDDDIRIYKEEMGI